MTIPRVPTTLKALADLKPYSKLGPSSDSAHWHQMFEKLQELECYVPFASWARELYKTSPTDTEEARFLAFLKRYYEENAPSQLGRWPAEYDTEEARFLWEEFQAFIGRTDDQAQERKAVLDGLRMSQELLLGVQEICFIPGVLFRRCLAIIHWADHIDDPVKRQLQSLRSLNQTTQRQPVLSAVLKARMQEEVEALTTFLELEFSRPSAVDSWRKQLGIDKRQFDAESQKHRLWSPIFKKLVDLICPFCRGPKQFTHLKTWMEYSREGFSPDAPSTPAPVA